MSVGVGTTRRTKILISFAIVYLVWGSTYLVTKIGVGHLPPFTFGAGRFVSGGLLLLLVARVLAARRGAPFIPAVTATDWRHLVCVGFCAVFVANGSSVWSLPLRPTACS